MKQILLEILRFSTIMLIIFVFSIVVTLATFSAFTFFAECYMFENSFIGAAILWPWGVWILSRKKNVQLFVFVSTLLGCVIAYETIGLSFYPECYSNAYNSTYAPLIYTISSGISSYIVWICYKQLYRNK